MSEPQFGLRQLFGALPKLVGERAVGQRVRLGSKTGSSGHPVEFTVSKLDFNTSTSRPITRVERQIDRAAKAAEASVLNPLGAFREGARLLAGAVEETVGAIQESPYDISRQSVDLLDDVVGYLIDLCGTGWTARSLDINVSRVKATNVVLNSSFRLVAVDIDFKARLAPAEVTAIVNSRLSEGLLARVDDEGTLFVDWTKSGGRVSGVCDITVVDGDIVVDVKRGTVLGKSVPLPKRYQHNLVIPLDRTVEGISISEVSFAEDVFVVAGSVPKWSRHFATDEIRAVIGQLG